MIYATIRAGILAADGDPNGEVVTDALRALGTLEAAIDDALRSLATVTRSDAYAVLAAAVRVEEA